MVDVYQQYFQHRIATTLAEREESFKLRYDVFCEDTHIFSPDAHPDGLERDVYDAHSLHGLLYYNPTQTLAGAVRIILPQADLPGLGLPTRQRAPALAELDLPEHSTGEVSRFAIAAPFRKRLESALDTQAGTALEPDVRWLISHVTLGLMTAVVEMTIRARLTHLCAVVEPALLRLLRRVGIYFIPHGPMVDYRGLRQPVWVESRALLAGIQALNPHIAAVICDRHRFTLNQVAQ